MAAGLLAGAWPAPASAQGSGIGFPIERPSLTPGVRAAATYSDNILLSGGGRSSDLVLEASPYINARSMSPRARYNIDYQLRNFWRVRDGDTNFFRHGLNANGSFALVDDRLWLDLSGFMGTINASAAGPISADPASSFTNTANVRNFTISPWYRDRFRNVASYDLRYSLSHAGGSSGFALAKLTHRGSASVAGLPRDYSPWNWSVYGNFERREFDGGIERNRRSSGVQLSYRVTPALRVSGTLDYEQIDEVRNSDGDNYGYGPGAGFDWSPNTRTSVSASVSRRYYGTIGNARAAYTTPGTTLGIQYSRGIITSADGSLTRLDPLALLGGPGGLPNSVLAALIANGLLVPGAMLTQGLYTDAAVFDRRITAFWGLRGARNSLTFSAYWSTRESTTELVAITAITGIRGSSVAGGVFSGELRERGAAVAYQHRLDARSSVDVTLDRRLNESSSGGFETRLTTLRTGYSTQLTSDTAAFAGYRHTRQSSGGTGSEYSENAIYGGIDMRFR